MKIGWKFKEHDIVADTPILFAQHIMIAKVIGKRNFAYHLLWLDNSSGWHGKDQIEKDYRELGWNIGFFKLFMVR